MKHISSLEIYLRTGRRVDLEPEPVEAKFNPWHDPDDGRFTFANQGRHFPRTTVPAKPPAAAKLRPGGRMSLKEIERHAANAKRMYDVHRARGMTSAQAAGWAANAQAESDGDYRRIQKGGPGRGLFQWGANNAKMDRRPHFHVLFKHPIEKSTEEEQLAFRDWELANTEVGAARRIAKAKSAGDIAAAITIHYERPKEKARDAADRANIAEAILRLEKEAILRRERDDILRRAKKER